MEAESSGHRGHGVSVSWRTTEPVRNKTSRHLAMSTGAKAYLEGPGRRSRGTAPGCSPPAAPCTRCAASTGTLHTAGEQPRFTRQKSRQTPFSSTSWLSLAAAAAASSILNPHNKSKRWLTSNFTSETASYFKHFLSLHPLKCALINGLNHKKRRKIISPIYFTHP